MDWLTPQLITSITALVTAIATLVGIVLTHGKVAQIESNTNGVMSKMQATIDRQATRIPGTSRAGDPPSPPAPGGPTLVK